MMSAEVREFVKNELRIVSDNNLQEYPLTAGQSGAHVYRILVNSSRSRLSGYYIVKVCPDSLSNETNEPDAAQRIISFSKKFADNHLVNVVAHKCFMGKEVIIYSQANNTVLYSTAFSLLKVDKQFSCAKQVSYDLLSELNSDSNAVGTLKDFFKTILHKQLGKNGRFKQRIETLLENFEATCVVLDGSVFPNPYFFISKIVAGDIALPINSLLRGAMHGDLHGYNLIISDKSYCIIDYDSANVDSFLLFDQAYLELSVFLDNSKDADLKAWKAMLDHLIKPSLFEEAVPPSYQYYVQQNVRNAVCAGIAKWVTDSGRISRRDDIDIQFLLARIAAGVNFFCKRSFEDQTKQRKVLFYICFCFEILLGRLKYAYDTNDVTTLSISSTCNDCDIEGLWENAFKYRAYLPILVTDDAYRDDDLSRLRQISLVRWNLVVDIGLEENTPIVYKSLLDTFKEKTINNISVFNDKKEDLSNRSLNYVSMRKKLGTTYAQLWRQCHDAIFRYLNLLQAQNPQVPLVLIFDCSKSSTSFCNRLVDRLIETDLPNASRFVLLRTCYSQDIQESIEAIQTEGKKILRFVEYPGASLIHVAQCCEYYLQSFDEINDIAEVPSIKGICNFSKEDLLDFSSSIELVYPGCENSKLQKNSQVGFDISGLGNSLGEDFYKGSEATWKDIADNRDIRLLPEVQYQDLKEKILAQMNESSPRIKKVKLVHGAGTGGTTLSKRILWDLKLSVPCVRLIRYTSKTASILLEIFKRTGKRLLVTVELGSTVITDEEFSTLVQQVDSENGKLFIILLTRAGNSPIHDAPKISMPEKDILVRLVDQMSASIAKHFLDTFSVFAKQRDHSEERINMLRTITGGSNGLSNQRTPFFYGFYTFQEEYNLLERLQSTMSLCTPEQKKLLNSLALVTIFSQNICISFSEVANILKIENFYQGTINIYVITEILPSAILKLMIIRENGYRMCHKIIAEKVLSLIYSTNEETIVYSAIVDFVNTLYDIYGDENEHVDGVLRELIIDRAYIDADDQKTRFSPLVEAIPKRIDREALFKLLIEKFPKNPHYYNHLARLIAFKDPNTNTVPLYAQAVQYALKAIDVATECDEATAIHRTTLGCIYSQWIIHDIREEINNKKRGRLSQGYDELIAHISVLYRLAQEQFECARNENITHDSFSYFPQINLEYQIISHLTRLGDSRTIRELIAQEKAFKQWYDEHFSIATELTIQMSELLNVRQNLLQQAKEKLGTLSQDGMSSIKNSLQELLHSNNVGDHQRRRTLIYGAFAANGCKWNGLDSRTCEVAEQNLRLQLRDTEESHKDADVQTWFELYRRCSYFDAGEAQKIITEYMDDENYNKFYILSLLSFILWKSKTAGSAPSIIQNNIKKAQFLARNRGINTTREYDCYVGKSTKRCPIVSTSEIERDQNRQPMNLEFFTGTVTEVQQTFGKILLDNLNLEAIFIPNPTTVDSKEKSVFTRQDVNCRVKLNLMFSYSGIRGWKVEKI